MASNKTDDSEYNPLRWNCDKGGPGVNCFNKKRRPKIEVFFDCFPGKISFGDVDGIVEINGCGLLLEWKTVRTKLPTGQSRMYKNLSLRGLLSVLIVVGDAEIMEVTYLKTIFRGEQSLFYPATLEDVKSKIKAWAKLAEDRKLFTLPTW